RDRVKDYRSEQLAIDGRCNGDAEECHTVNEIAGAINRINDPLHFSGRGQSLISGDLFFAQYPRIRLSGQQRGGDQLLAASIDVSDQIVSVALMLCLDICTEGFT